MIKEDRVKELYRLAVAEQNCKQEEQSVGRFFQSDYVEKEVIKSFFYGTILFGLMIALYVLEHFQTILDELNHIDFVGTAIITGMAYLAFLCIYMLITYVVYSVRYSKKRERLEEYKKHLKQLQKMYTRDERLKM